MGDHDELRLSSQATKDAQEAAQVGVIERRLDLVKQVERRGASHREREHEGHRDQRSLTTGHERHRTWALVGRYDLDHDALLAILVLRLHKTKAAGAAGEQPSHNLGEALRHRLENGFEAFVDRVVELTKMCGERLAALLQVIDLLGQVLLAFGEFGPLLRGKLIDGADVQATAFQVCELFRNGRRVKRLLRHFAGDRPGLSHPLLRKAQLHGGGVQTLARLAGATFGSLDLAVCRGKFLLDTGERGPLRGQGLHRDRRGGLKRSRDPAQCAGGACDQLQSSG